MSTWISYIPAHTYFLTPYLCSPHIMFIQHVSHCNECIISILYKHLCMYATQEEAYFQQYGKICTFCIYLLLITYDVFLLVFWPWHFIIYVCYLPIFYPGAWLPATITRRSAWDSQGEVPPQQHRHRPLLGHHPARGEPDIYQNFVYSMFYLVWMLWFFWPHRLGPLPLQWIWGEYEGDWYWRDFYYSGILL